VAGKLARDKVDVASVRVVVRNELSGVATEGADGVAGAESTDAGVLVHLAYKLTSLATSGL
jgi:hypothetical protein